MTKPVAIVTRRWPEKNEERLKELFDVSLNETDIPFTSDQLKEALQNCDVLMPTVTDKITADVLSVENRRANMIGNFGVGFNHIDLNACKKYKIVVTNTPDILTDATADLTGVESVTTVGLSGLDVSITNKEFDNWILSYN